MNTQIGRGHIIGLSGGSFTWTNPDASTFVGTVTYDERSLRFAHNATVSNIKDEDGDTCALTAVDEVLECTFNFIPYGTSVAVAKTSAAAPKLLGGATISGLPVVPMGTFADALNTATDGQPWVYEGGWEVNGSGDGEPWSVSVTLRRYPNITSVSAIS